MAIRYLTNIDLTENEIQNVKAQNLASDPTGYAGQFIFNTTSNTFKYYNGSSWISLDGTGDIAGVTAGAGLSGGGTSGTVRIYANPGTGADSINIESDGGGITLDAGNTTHGVKVGTVDSAPVTIGHTTSETTVADNLTVTGNATVSGNLTASANLTATTVNGQTFTNTLGATGGVVRIFNPVSYQSGVGDGYVGSGSGITTTVTGRIHTSGAGNGSVNGPTTQITTPADGMDVYLLTVVATRKDGDGSLGTAYSHYSGAYIVTITSETNNRMTITALAEDDTESKLSVSSGNNGYVEIILATSSTFQGRMRFNLLQLIRGDKD